MNFQEIFDTEPFTVPEYPRSEESRASVSEQRLSEAVTRVIDWLSYHYFLNGAARFDNVYTTVCVYDESRLSLTREP